MQQVEEETKAKQEQQIINPYNVERLMTDAVESIYDLFD